MQKTKFKIKGMHCKSCAILIEEKLKNQPGIVNAKVNYDSGKAIIIYDQQKIQEDKIFKTIKETGDYRIEKIEKGEDEIEEIKINSFTEKKNGFEKPEKVLRLLKIIAGLVIVSLGLNVFLAIAFFKQPQKESTKEPTAQNQDLPADKKPSSLPTEQPSIIQAFEITKNNHIRGDFNAPITLIEFSDFECPFCERHYLTLNKILSDYEGTVRLVYKHFPLGFHPNAEKAAEASECAAEQGKFWEYHDKLFENQPAGYSTEKFKQWAKDLGLNREKFNNCLDSDKFAEKVQNDYQEGAKKGVNGTPATFVNGRMVSGALPYETFKQIIDDVISQ